MQYPKATATGFTKRVPAMGYDPVRNVFIIFDFYKGTMMTVEELENPPRAIVDLVFAALNRN